MKPTDIEAYNVEQDDDARAICVALAEAIDAGLPRAESKVWHGGPVCEGRARVVRRKVVTRAR